MSGPGEPDTSGTDDEQELVLLTRTLDAFQTYAPAAERNLVKPRRERYNRLSEYEKECVEHFFLGHLNDVEDAIQDNGFFLACVKDSAAQMFLPQSHFDPSTWTSCAPTDMDKVQSTLRQVAREWSVDGQHERDATYGVIINELINMYPQLEARHEVRVLVPGCGLGRLPFDLAAQGFQAQGNEFSFHMLFTSHLLLNNSSRNMYRVRPYIHTFSHHQSRANQLREVLVPDVSPQVLSQQQEMDETIPEDGLLSMTAGSFDDIYPPHDGSLFDVVATVFFIDTAPNIFKTLRAIADSLKPGGIWFNLGPLLWHYEEIVQDERDAETQERSRGLELTVEDLLELLPRFGFRVEERRSGLTCTYAATEPATTGSFAYNCEYWRAVRL